VSELSGDVCVLGVVAEADYSEEDEKERRQLIEQVFELQNTLDGQSMLISYLLTYSSKKLLMSC